MLTLKTNALLAEQKYQEALDTARQCLRIEPDNVSQLINKGRALQGLGDHQSAAMAFTEALGATSRRIDDYVDKTALLLQQDRYTEALEVAEQGLRHDRHHLQLLINKSTALLGLEHYDQVLATTAAALNRHPQNSALLINRSLALTSLQQFPEALAAAISAAKISEDDQILEVIVEEMLEVMDYDASIEHIVAATAETPNYRILLHHHCAKLLLNQDRLDETLRACEILLQADPRNHSGHAIKGCALARLTHFDEAKAVFEHACRLYEMHSTEPFIRRPEDIPEDTFVPDHDPEKEYVDWEFARLVKCDWSRREAFLARLPGLIESHLKAGKTAPIANHNALYLPLPPSLHLAMARSLSEHVAVHMGPTLPLRKHHQSTQKLRIGYVSGDFRDNATAHLIQGMFDHHDHSRYEIIGYSLCSDDDSEYRRRIAAGCDRFFDLTNLSNAEAARRIYEDAVDILIDLGGYTYYARPEIFALRPTPVQVSFLVYAGTSGAEFIQYFIADPIVLPNSMLPYFSETPVYMPDCYQVTHRQTIAETGMTRTDVGLPENAFVFCCFNNSKKIEPKIFDIWMRLLHKVPDSVLWLYARTPEVPDNLRREAQARDIDPHRLVFAGHLDKPRHLERHRLADLFLDTFIYTAHTTASDALWAGLPVLTRRGDTFPSRVAASILTAVGLPELIVDTDEDYEKLALHLATHPTALRALRDKLDRNRLTQPLFDTERFVRHLERAFEAMWADYTAGVQPRPIHIKNLDR